MKHYAASATRIVRLAERLNEIADEWEHGEEEPTFAQSLRNKAVGLVSLACQMKNRRRTGEEKRLPVSQLGRRRHARIPMVKAKRKSL
jgi:hypothetical protein